MSQVSPRLLAERSKTRVKEVFLDALASLKNHQQAKEFFDTFFTATEKVNLPKRFSIFLLLIKGDGYDTVCKKLRVSRIMPDPVR